MQRERPEKSISLILPIIALEHGRTQCRRSPTEKPISSYQLFVARGNVCHR